MFTLDDRGVIRFKKPYKFLYEVFYHSMKVPYTIGPRDSSPSSSRTVLLHGQGFLLTDGSPFVRLGSDSLSTMAITTDTNVNMKMYRLSISTGRMVPVLNTCYDLVDVDLEALTPYTLCLEGVNSVCIYASEMCSMTVNISTRPSCKQKPTGKIAVANSKCEVMPIYNTIEVGYNDLLLDAVCPCFAGIEYLVQNSLSVLSVNPPLIEFAIATDSSVEVHECNMVYRNGDLWSDFKGGPSAWTLSLKLPQTLIRKIVVVTNYTTDSGSIAGTLVIQHKYAPGRYVDCDASINRVRFADISRIEVDNVRLLKAYDGITIVVKTDANDSTNIMSSRCRVEL